MNFEHPNDPGGSRAPGIGHESLDLAQKRRMMVAAREASVLSRFHGNSAAK
jgi:hypothetical protein